MPELPEVETVVRSLRPRVVGRTIRSVEPLDPKYAPLLDAGFAGRTIRAVLRRGKFIFLRFDAAPDAAFAAPDLLVHLRMSGRLVAGARLAPERFDRVRFRLDGGAMVYRDARKLGDVRPGSFEECDAKLGPEPLESGFTAGVLGRALARTRVALKVALLDQSRVAGIGNIYAAEILHRARLDPRRPANGLSAAETKRLHAATVAILDAAVAGNGTSLSDAFEYRDASGNRGSFQDSLAVYGREGRPCPACGSAIERIVQAARSTCFCPRCQG